MKKWNVLWIVLAVFGGVSAYEVIIRFGWQDVDLQPVAFFFYSLWVAIRNFVTYTLAFLALPFILGRGSRWVLIPLAVYILLVECSMECARYAFHADLSSVWLDLILDTSPGEIANFIQLFLSLGMSILLLAFGTLLTLTVVFLWKSRYPRASVWNLLIGLGLLAPFVLFNFMLTNWHSGVAQMNYTSFAIATVQSWRNMQGVRNACLKPQLPERIETDVPLEKLPSVVFVIGESATRNNWNLYGYPRSTTPRMNEICHTGGGVFYSDVVGTQPDTVGALSLLLTDVEFDRRNEGNWTLAEVYRRAGYRCVLISNQSWWGDTSSMLYRLFNGCEKRVNLSHECTGKCFDEKVLPFLEQELSVKESRPVAIFIHLAGMHFPVQNVTPPSDSYYSDKVEPDVLKGLSERDKDRRNRYDDAIRYEDKVLGMIVDILRARDNPSCLFFCSDHGESPRSAGWRDYESADVYEIPVIFWFSRDYGVLFPQIVRFIAGARDKPLQQDQLTHGLLSLGLVKPWCEEVRVRSFQCPTFNPRQPRVINKGRQKYAHDL